MDSRYGTCASSTPFHSTEFQKVRRREHRRNVNLFASLVMIVVPCAIFVTAAYLLTFSLHYNNPHVSRVLVASLLLIVFLWGHLAYSASAKEQGVIHKPVRYTFLCASSLLAWIVGTIVGELNFNHHMALYYDITNLNVYPSVDPTQSLGQELMDAGRMIFLPGSHLDMSKSMGFRNHDMYCVAPVTLGTQNQTYYDFWAVGVNCCSGKTNDFRCGEFNNPHAVAGLRLVQDSQRVLFRLAVQQAEAAYKIQAGHPIFLHWIQDPIAKINDYYDEGYKYFLLSVFSFFVFQLFTVAIGTIIFSKMDG